MSACFFIGPFFRWSLKLCCISRVYQYRNLKNIILFHWHCNVGADYQRPKMLRMMKKMTLREKVLMKVGTLKMIQIGFGASARNHIIIVLWYVVTLVRTGSMASVLVSPKAWVRCLFTFSIYISFMLFVRTFLYYGTMFWLMNTSRKCNDCIILVLVERAVVL